MIFSELTIVTSCTGYGKYLLDWVHSIVAQTVKPGRVCLFTHGSKEDNVIAQQAIRVLLAHEIPFHHVHDELTLDFGVARNRAVSLAPSEWVMHLDTDDTLFPDAVEDLQRVAPTADVVQSGYQRVGQMSGMSTRTRLYTGCSGDGVAMLDRPALASGNSMFRRSLWLQTPYREDLLGAWDTCLWIGFARLGARFRPSTRAIFRYRQHADSIFNRRQRASGWTRAYTDAMIKSLRRSYRGVAILVPRDVRPNTDRARNWDRVKAHYTQHHPEWSIIEGFCQSVTWSKGAALQDALNRCNAAVIVIADADVMVSPDALRESVALVESQAAPWSVPHLRVHRANLAWTLAICASDSMSFPTAQELDRPVYDGFRGGGLVVMRHVDYRATGGIPLGFRGWGHEDQALATICTSLLGPCHRGSADLLHLWHVPQPKDPYTNSNLQLLRTIGQASQQGPDVLVRSLAAILKQPLGTYQAQRTQPTNRAALQARMEQRRGAP